MGKTGRKNKTCGYRRVLAVMLNKGYVINHKTVSKLMKLLRLKGKQRKNDKYHSYKGEVGKVADNLLKRDFKAENDRISTKLKGMSPVQYRAHSQSLYYFCLNFLGVLHIGAFCIIPSRYPQTRRCRPLQDLQAQAPAACRAFRRLQ